MLKLMLFKGESFNCKNIYQYYNYKANTLTEDNFDKIHISDKLLIASTVNQVFPPIHQLGSID